MPSAVFTEIPAETVTDCGCYSAATEPTALRPPPIARQVCAALALEADPCRCECHAELPSGADYARQIVDFAASIRNYPGPALADPDTNAVFSFYSHDQPTADTLLHHAAAVMFQADSVARFCQTGQSQNNADRARVLTKLVAMLESRQFPTAEISRFRDHCADAFWP